MSSTDVRPLRRLMRSAGVDVWAVLHTLIDVAAADHPQHLRKRRAVIVRRLDAAILSAATAGGPASPLGEAAKASRDKKRKRAAEVAEEEEGVLIRAAVEKTKIREMAGARAAPTPPPEAKGDWSEIFSIKRFLEDPYAFEITLVYLLKDLTSMAITYEALLETQIGRSVNNLRKHASPRVRQLAMTLVGEWRGVADAWVEENQEQKGREAQVENCTGGAKPEPCSHGQQQQLLLPSDREGTEGQLTE